MRGRAVACLIVLILCSTFTVALTTAGSVRAATQSQPQPSPTRPAGEVLVHHPVSAVAFRGPTNARFGETPPAVDVQVLPPLAKDAAALAADKRNPHARDHGVDTTDRSMQSPQAGVTIAQPEMASTIGTSFDGADINGGVNNGGLITPPDVNVAAGPNHLVEAVNLRMLVYSKSGSFIGSTSLSSFFGSLVSGYGLLSDPRILYDAQSGRWFLALIGYNSTTSTGSIWVAVSTSDDPTTTWYQWKIQDFSHQIPDYPGIGVSDDKFAVATNAFSWPSGTFIGAQYVWMTKSDLTTNVGQLTPRAVSPISTAFSIQPAQSMTSTSDLFMTSIDTDTTASLFVISGVGSTSSTVRYANRSVSSSTPPSAAQPGTNALLDTGDSRVQRATWRAGRLWASGNKGCLLSNDTAVRSCIHMYQIDTAAVTVLQDFGLGAVGAYYFYPAVQTDTAGNLYAAFGRSSSAIAPEFRVSLQLATDSINMIGGSVQVKAGNGAYTCTWCSSTSPARFGDFFGAALDPSDGTKMWIAGEYGKATTAPCNGCIASDQWGTYVSQVTAVSTICTTLAISSYPSSPQVGGTSVSWTGSSNCTSPTFKWFTLPPGGGTNWQLAQDWSSGTFSWSTTGLVAGTWTIQAWVRQSGSTATYEAWTQTTYTLTAFAPACATVSLSPSPASPKSTGTLVTWSASSVCYSPTFKFFTLAPGAGANWQVAQDWGGATFVWDTSGLITGTWSIQVWVRQSGSSATYESWTQAAYALTTPDATNHPPTANAGTNQTVASGYPAVLDGSGSSDPDGDPLTYNWIQLSGPAANLSSVNAVHATFVATTIGSYVFRLTVTDGRGGSSSASVTVTAGNPTAAYLFTTVSQPGDYVGGGQTDVLDNSNGNVFAISGTSTYLSFGVHTVSYSDWWNGSIRASALSVGTYTGATRMGTPGLDIGGNGRGCNTSTGQFTIREIAFDSGGAVTDIDVVFEQHCEGFVPALFGELRYNATTPLPTVCGNVSIAPLPISPQPVGATVTWTGSSNCSSPTYKWFTLAPGGGTNWQLAQDWSSGTFSWNTTGLAAGTWSVQTWARQSGSTATYESWTQTTYTITAPAPTPTPTPTPSPSPNQCSSVAISPSPTSPQTAGASVTWTPSAVGCSSPTYKWFTLAPGGGTNWQLAQDWSTGTFSWNTAALAAGTWMIQTWARQSGSSATYESWTQTTYVLNAPAPTPTPSPTPTPAPTVCSSISIAPNPTSPQQTGTMVTWTPSSNCGSPTYKWFTLAPNAGTNWQLAQDWSSGSFGWDTTSLATGTWTIQVWARQNGSSATYESWTQMTYQLTSGTPSVCASVAISPNVPSPQSAGTTITWTASAGGCGSPQFKWFTLAPSGGTNWQLAQDWGSGSFSWTTTGLPTGTWLVQTWVRQSGSTATYEAWTQTGYNLN